MTHRTTLSLSLALTLGLSATALAQQAKQPAPPPPPAAPAKGAPAAPAKGAPAAPAADAKKAPAAAPPTTAAPADARKPQAPATMPATLVPPALPAAGGKPAPMPMPTPPAEVAEYLKTMGGTWRCTGTMSMDPTDPTKAVPAKVTIASKADLGKFWIATTMTFTAPMKAKGVMYQTYDAGQKKWWRTMVDSMGASEWSWSDGVKDGKMVWLGEGRGMGPATMKLRTTETMVSPKEVKMVGEMSMDGKKWMQGWEATCKK